MAYTFSENRILRVTPGQQWKRLNYDMDVVSMNQGARSFTSSTSCHPDVLPGRLKLYVRQMKLTKSCMNHIKRECKDDVFIKLKWSFFDFQDVITSPEKLENNKTKFDFTVKYPLLMEDDFLDRLNENPLSFELYAVTSGKEISLSVSQYYFENLIDVVNTKQEIRINFYSDIVDSSGESIAYLDIWYKFNCKQKTLKSLFANTRLLIKKKKNSAKLSNLLTDKFASTGRGLGTVQLTDSEIDQFSDGLLLVLNRNKVLKTTQSDMDTELEQRVRWLRFEANWKQTLQENAILHGKDPKDVVWRQWREENTANVRLRTYHDKKPQDYDPKLVITVVKVMFFEGSAPLRNDSIKKIYVEYSFLTSQGPEMETPFSLKKRKANEDIVFNFRKIFDIDLERNNEACRLLADLIRRDGKIKFMVVNEPEESLDKPIQACNEIGYAEVLLSELVQLEENEDIFEYEIVDINNPIAVVGYLTIKLEGILAMRKMALTILAPKDYKLYM